MVLGPVMLDVEDVTLSDAERRRLSHPLVGGVILFARNYASPEQLAALVAEIHALRNPPLLVAVDQEGGRVQRFRDGFTRLPAVGELGERYDEDPAAAVQLAEVTGWLMAAELRGLGVDMSFAPVLDIDRGCCPVIGDRAFHRAPEVIAELAHAWQRGMREAGMQAVGKHFPGHGGVTEDSHQTLPVDRRELAALQLEDMLPFERLIHQGLAGVMSAHVVYEAIDPSPASFSPFWLREQLRGVLGFTGAIFSDDLSMLAAETVGDPLTRARRALEAGCDMVLVCNQPVAADEILHGLADWHDPASAARLAHMRGRPAPDWEALHGEPAWREAVEAICSYDVDPLLDMDME